MARETEKKIKISVQSSGTKELQNIKGLLQNLTKLAEELSETTNESAKEQTNSISTLVKLLQQENIARKEKLDQEKIELDNQKKKEAALKRLREQRQEEDRQIASSREKQKFWAEDVWKGSPLQNIWDKVKPTTLLKKQLSKSWSAQDASIAKAREAVDAGELAAESSATAEMAAASGATSGEAAGVSASSGAAAAGAAILPVIIALELMKRAFDQFKEDFKVVMGYSLSIKDTFKDIRDTMSEYTNMQSGMATYSLGSSLVMNQAARQTQLQYGLSGGQAFAFDRARALLGIQSDEDFAFMNESQRSLFNQYMERQTEFYDRLESSGVLQSIQELQMEFAIFKEEMSMSFMEWIADHKDEIMSVLKGSFIILKGLVTAFAKLFTLFGIDTSELGSISVSDAAAQADISARSLSDRVSNNSWSNNNRSVNMNMTVNATGVLGSQEEMESFFTYYMNKAVSDVVASET